MSNEHVCEIALLKKEHAESMAFIHTACFPYDIWSKETFESFCDELWGNVIGWMAVYENREVGFILARQVIDTAEILSFAVLPDFQGKGIGRQLLNQLMDTIEVPLFLEVSVDNKSAIYLYESAGFKIMTTRKNYYNMPGHMGSKDAYLMRCG